MSPKPRSRSAHPIEPDDVEPMSAKPATAGPAKDPVNRVKPAAKPTNRSPKATNRKPKKPAGPAQSRTDFPALTVIEGAGLRSERAWAARMASNAPALVSEPESTTALELKRLEAVVVDPEPTKEHAPKPESVEAVVSQPKRKRIRRPVGIPPELLAWPRRRRTSVGIRDSLSRQTGRPWWSDAGSGWVTRKSAGRGALVAFLVVSLLIAAPLVIDALLEGGSVDRSGAIETARPPDETRVVDVGGVTSMHELFDDLPMSSTLPDPWTVAGDGVAEIVALPTSVDRSVRLASSAEGGSVHACRPSGISTVAPFRITVDYLVGHNPPHPAPLLWLQSGDAVRVGFGIDATGAPIHMLDRASANATAVPSPLSTTGGGIPVWQRLEVTIDAGSGSLTWVAYSSSGAETRAGTGPVSGLMAEPLDTICLTSPEGMPSGWVAIDDLIIQG